MVSRGLGRAELVLQFVMADYPTHAALIEKFVRLLPDTNIQDLQKVLEMRGVKDRATVLELFRQRTLGSPAVSDPCSPAHPTSAIGNPSPEPETSKIARL